MIAVRSAELNDLPFIAQLIRDLAAFGKMSDGVSFTNEDLKKHIFGDYPKAEVLIGERDNVAVGFALFFTTFSTFRGKPSLYLEDLFVKDEARGLGLGTLFFTRLSELAEERHCARLEWVVLDWNQKAIDFYNRLGAEMQPDFRIMRLSISER